MKNILVKKIDGGNYILKKCQCHKIQKKAVEIF